MDTRKVSTTTLNALDEVVLFLGEQRWVVRAAKNGGLEIESHVLIPPPVLDDDATVTLGRPPTPVYRPADLRITFRRRTLPARLIVEALEDER